MYQDMFIKGRKISMLAHIDKYRCMMIIYIHECNFIHVMKIYHSLIFINVALVVIHVVNFIYVAVFDSMR
jgi:hypothetical protein